MTATMHNRINQSIIALVRLSTVRLIDDYRTPLRPPIKPATATIAEIIAAKGICHV